VVARWDGRLAVALQRALRLSNEQFANELGRPTRTVAKWHERPDVQLREPNQQDLDTLLHRSPAQVQDRFALLAEQAFSLAAVVAKTRIDPWELAEAVSRASLSGSVLDELERVCLEYAVNYGRYAPRLIDSPAERIMTRLGDALKEPQSLSAHERCVRLVGLMSGVMGNLSIDAGRLDRAAGFFNTGRLAGREVRDDDLVAWISANQSIGWFFAGQYEEAVELLLEARSLAEHASSSQRRSWIAALLARALAAHGQDGAARQALDQAHTLIGVVSERRCATDFFEDSRLAALTGACMLSLRDSDEATKLLSEALAARSAHDLKGRALITLDLAACRAVDGDLEEASNLALGALDIARGTVVRPIVERATGVRAAMTKWEGSPALVELDARLGAATE
jgi:tetratricopeptide (TPR) repeat protein